MKPIHRMTRYDVHCEIATERQKKGVSADDCWDYVCAMLGATGRNEM